MTDVRDPAVAGRFYAGSPDDLRDQIEACFRHERGPGAVPAVEGGSRASSGRSTDGDPSDDVPRADPPETAAGSRASGDVLALVSPHAAYQFSGPIAAHGVAAVARDRRPETLVVLGPNHRGVGPAVAASGHGAWRTPLGRVAVDRELQAGIVDRADAVEPDALAHRGEHSIEVQLPPFQYVFGDDLAFVPLCFASQDERTCRAVADAVAGALSATGRDALLVASSDLTHHEPHEVAVERDRRLLAPMEAREPWRLLARAREEGHTACGVGPVATALAVANARGATDAETLGYATSGEIGGRRSEVVGYCSVGVTR